MMMWDRLPGKRKWSHKLPSKPYALIYLTKLQVNYKDLRPCGTYSIDIKGEEGPVHGEVRLMTITSVKVAFKSKQRLWR